MVDFASVGGCLLVCYGDVLVLVVRFSTFKDPGLETALCATRLKQQGLKNFNQ